MRPLRLTLAPLALLLALACSAPSWQVVPLPDLDSAIPAGACRVVVTRDARLIGSARDVRVYDGEREIGAVGQGGYLCWDRPASRGVGRVVFSGYKLDRGPVENVFDLPRGEGTTTWLVIRLREGDRKPLVEAVDAEEGRALVAERSPASER